MAKRKSKGVGAYAKNDVVFQRPRNVDPETGDVRQPKRDISEAVTRVSGMGLSRPVTQVPTKRYGP